MDIREDWQCLHEGVMLCGAHLDGTHFHVEVIRVKTVRGVQCGYNSEAQRYLDNMGLIDCGDGPFHTVKLPGYAGKWVLNILPGKD